MFFRAFFSGVVLGRVFNRLWVPLGCKNDPQGSKSNPPDPQNHKLPVLGANDGASGVAVLLVLAEILHTLPPLNIGIDLLFVDGEDMGKPGDPDKFGLGTQAVAKHVPEPRPQFAICLDMVADK